uniref:Aminoacyl-tRNA hydrolase n=1 Tax=Macrostomum lignano TaxID=282301 RepID=A0A1I8F4Q0_9PLAT
PTSRTFIVTARLYNMAGVLAQIDKVHQSPPNLLSIADGPALSQLLGLRPDAGLPASHALSPARDRDVFRCGVSSWLDARDQQQAVHGRQLLTEIRYNLIAPSIWCRKYSWLRQLWLMLDCTAYCWQTLNYHVLPHCLAAVHPARHVAAAATRDSWSALAAATFSRRTPGLRTAQPCCCRKPSQGATAAVAAAESSLIHAQCVVLNNFPVRPGGCVTQCAHAESAVKRCERFDLRFNAWY